MHMDTLSIPKAMQENMEPFLPPGYRFHPTDEELVVFYLANKVCDSRLTMAVMAEVDLNMCEPWDLPDKAKLGEKEWYFFSLKDRKYPTGLRTNRATEAGYWKATGKDREVKSSRHGFVVGMKKTLVFYKGRAPRGAKTNWIMHEYRLEGESPLLHLSKSMKDEWVVCRIFRKNSLEKKMQVNSHDRPCALPGLLESPHTVAAAEEIGITDNELSSGQLRHNSISHLHNQYSSTKLQSTDIAMNLSRGKDPSAAAARYIVELPLDQSNMYNMINRLPGDHQVVQNWRSQQLPSSIACSDQKSSPLPSLNMPLPTSGGSYNTSFPASGFVFKSLLEQFSNNSGRSYNNNIEPQAADHQTLPPKLNYKCISNNNSLSSNAHVQFETSPVFGGENDALIRGRSANLNHIPALSCVGDVNTNVHTLDQCQGMGSRPTTDRLPHTDRMEILWSY